MTDLWIPRILLLGEIAVLVTCAVLLGTGHDGTIQALFAAAAGGLLTSRAVAIVKGAATKETR
jgi:hypothetical protein